MSSRHPIVKWAQRSDKVFITADLPDAKDVKLKLDPEGKFSFSATKDGVSYQVELELFEKVNVEGSKYNIGVREIVYVVKKGEEKWWPRLIKQEGKSPAFLKVDWDKWVEEDEEDDKRFDFDDMDFSKMDMGEDYDDDLDDLDESEVVEGGAEATTAAEKEEPLVEKSAKEAKAEEEKLSKPVAREN